MKASAGQEGEEEKGGCRSRVRLAVRRRPGMKTSQHTHRGMECHTPFGRLGIRRRHMPV